MATVMYKAEREKGGGLSATVGPMIWSSWASPRGKQTVRSPFPKNSLKTFLTLMRLVCSLMGAKEIVEGGQR